MLSESRSTGGYVRWSYDAPLIGAPESRSTAEACVEFGCDGGCERWPGTDTEEAIERQELRSDSGQEPSPDAILSRGSPTRDPNCVGASTCSGTHWDGIGGGGGGIAHLV